ncbi:MAG: hypothetical protein H5U08_07310 [Thermogutta sp.]|uniref:hypothetical protein n=1 Tax=Thermogutta sp. TaxID=1962930 RepID=UPI00198DC23B|nr:hypothetical protein [Thermogutta sp.]MBC7352151.1 hypothetical protein [Thermogutta sp.]
MGKRWSVVCFALAMVLVPAAIVSRGETRAEPAGPKMGINLAGPADWNTELPFVDVFKLSRPWISQQKGKPWGQGPRLDLDEHGWVRSLQPDCWAETLMCTIDGGHYPSGQYTVLYDGKGKIEVGNAARVLQEHPGRMVIEVDSKKGAIFLRITQTDPADYIRNIRVIMPGFADVYEKEPFHPDFLKRWAGVRCFRFMDWMETNGSRIARWEDRPVLEDATFCAKGVPLELMIDLCNRQKADAWFCMPHLADDEYIRKFAQLVKERLDPQLKVYIEYSNEVWNGMFEQSRWAGEQGIRLGFAEKPWEAAWRYTAWRSVQIFRIWEEVFGGRDRLVRVLPTQAANPYVSEQILSFQDAYKHADVLAIAPYISMNVHSSGDGPTAEEVAQWSLDKLLDHVENRSLPQAIEWMKRQKEVANRFGVGLVAYEAGQHLVAVGTANRNEKLVELLKQANRHPQMGRIYDKYFQAWEEIGGGLCCHFSSVGRWSQWGSWGLLEYADESPAQSPKFQAFQRWLKKWNVSAAH